MAGHRPEHGAPAFKSPRATRFAAADQPTDPNCADGLPSRHPLTNAYELLTRVVGRSKTLFEDAAPIGRCASNA